MRNKLKRINIWRVKTIWRLNLNNELTQQNKNRLINKSTSNNKRRLHISQSSPLSSQTYAWLLVFKLTTRVTPQAINWVFFFTYMVFFFIEPSWFFIRGGKWRKPPRNVSYTRTFGVPDHGQMLDVWGSQTAESALTWETCYAMPRHILELTLEVIPDHKFWIKTLTLVSSPGS